ncbi:MAG: hypothetical protein WBB01_21750 [Phormidesmis sp.]
MPNYRPDYTAGSTIFLTWVTYRPAPLFSHPDTVTLLRQAVSDPYGSTTNQTEILIADNTASAVTGSATLDEGQSIQLSAIASAKPCPIGL